MDVRIYLFLIVFISAPAFTCEKGAAALSRVVEGRINGRFPIRAEKLQTQVSEVKDVLPKSLSSTDEKDIAKFLTEAHNNGPIKSEAQFFKTKEKLDNLLSSKGYLEPSEISNQIFERTLNQRHISLENSFARVLNEETSGFLRNSAYTDGDAALSKGLKALEKGEPMTSETKAALKELANDIDDFESTSMAVNFSKMKDKSTESKSWVDGYFSDVAKKEVQRNPSLNPYKPSTSATSTATKNPDVVKMKLEGSESGQGAWEFSIKKNDPDFVYITDIKTGLEFAVKDSRARSILRGRVYKEWALAHPKEAKVKNLELLKADVEKGTSAITQTMGQLLEEVGTMTASHSDKASQVLKNVNELKQSAKQLKESLADAEDWELQSILKKLQSLYKEI